MHTLANRYSALELSPGRNIYHLGELLEGDADNDNDVDGTDASIVNLAFGSEPGDAEWDPRADFNEDDKIDGVDMGLLAGSFGLSGDIAVEAMPPAAQASSRLLRSARDSMGFPIRHPRVAPLASSSDSSVTVLLYPHPIVAQVGDVIDVDVLILAGAQMVDTVDAHIYFPSRALRAVDAGGMLASQVTGAGEFDFELINSVDNSAGEIHYGATMLGGSLTGDITVATLQFQVLLPISEAWIRFQVWPPHRTDVTYRGQSVLTSWPGTAVTAEGEAVLYLPLMVK
jgi:hypothetical protein